MKVGSGRGALSNLRTGLTKPALSERRNPEDFSQSVALFRVCGMPIVGKGRVHEYLLLVRQAGTGEFVLSAAGDAAGTGGGRRRLVPDRPDRLGLAGPRPGGREGHPGGIPALGASARVGLWPLFLAVVFGFLLVEGWPAGRCRACGSFAAWRRCSWEPSPAWPTCSSTWNGTRSSGPQGRP